jgi:hypothetical protein
MKICLGNENDIDENLVSSYELFTDIDYEFMKMTHLEQNVMKTNVIKTADHEYEMLLARAPQSISLIDVGSKVFVPCISCSIP